MRGEERFVYWDAALLAMVSIEDCCLATATHHWYKVSHEPDCIDAKRISNGYSISRSCSYDARREFR